MRLLLSTLLLLSLRSTVFAQTATEPKTYQNFPNGTQMFQAGYIHRTTNSTLDGDIAFDNNTVDIRANVTYLRYARFFNLAGKTAGAQIMLPYVGIDADILGNNFRQSGFGDIMVILGSNIIGGDAMSVEELAKTARKTALAWSLATTTPTGSYRQERLLNPGGNRWQFKPEIGLTVPSGKWDLEAYVHAKFFTANHAFRVPDAQDEPLRVTQKPFLGGTFHLVYNWTDKFWISGDVAGRAGGETTKDGVVQHDSQRILGLGGTVNYGLGRHHQFGLNFISNAAGNENAPHGAVTGLKYSYIIN